MGRPLNKKYFGNRNVGSLSVTTDNGIGGASVASAAIATPSSYTARPTFAFSTPSLPTGVLATGGIVSEVLSAAVSGTQTGTYVIGDLITISTAGGSAIAYVDDVLVGAVVSVNFTGTGATRGSFTTLGTVTTTGGSGVGVVLAPTYQALSVTITEPGSGYVAAPTIATGPSQGVAINLIILTVDSGFVGTVLNQENAIVAYAYTGSSSKIADIVKQVASRRYLVNTVDTAGVAVAAKLKSSAAIAAGEMTVMATDANGNTYFVTKLTSHKALLTQGVQSGSNAWLYATGETAPWKFAVAAGVYVQIENN
jgi:hypothetical protein